MELSSLKNKHKYEDVWVIGSGSSLDFIDKSFFENKITVGVNRSCCYFECDYVVAKDLRGLEEIEENTLNKNIQKIYSLFNCGNTTSTRNDENNDKDIIYFHHPQNGNPRTEIIGTTNSNGEDLIIVSLSTITSAIHIAAYMGAKNIIICGHDCGKLNNNISIKGYNSIIPPVQGANEYVEWLNRIENHTIKVCKKLKEVYNCNIHSLNPFINFNLEGFKFESNPKINERRFS